MTKVSEMTREERIAYTRGVVRGLLEDYDVSDPRTAHQDIRDRMSQADYEIYKECLAYLYGQGVLG